MSINLRAGVSNDGAIQINQVDVLQVASGGVTLPAGKTAKATPTTDNDLSFDLTAGNNFDCTPAAAGTLTFTNMATQAGQSGYVFLVNASNYAIAAHANTKIDSTDLARISVTGSYLLSYFVRGSNVYVTASRNLA